VTGRCRETRDSAGAFDTPPMAVRRNPANPNDHKALGSSPRRIGGRMRIEEFRRAVEANACHVGAFLEWAGLATGQRNLGEALTSLQPSMHLL
jgi:hypothetical protein